MPILFENTDKIFRKLFLHLLSQNTLCYETHYPPPSCFKLTFLLILIGINSYGQQWNGSASSTGLITREGEITVFDRDMSRISLGSVRGNELRGHGYVGFNLRREPNGLWSFLDDGKRNDGAVVYQSENSVLFSMTENRGAFSGVLHDYDIQKNVAFKFNGALNTLTVGRNTGNYLHAVSIGPAWGPGRMYGEGYIGFNLERDDAAQWVYKSDGGANGSFVIYAGVDGSLNFAPRPNTGSSGGSLSDNDVVSNRRFQIHASGKVIVGDPENINIYTPGNYSLYVENGILTERVRVAVKTTQAWSDYVFAPDYKLTSLTELDAFVKTNRHLPGVPSAQEVVRDGIDAAQMDAKLLEKIEELTLHLIAQDKKIAALQAELKGTRKKKR